MNTSRTLLIATALTLSVIANPANAENWYVAHIGADSCVPVEDIDPTNVEQRLYYGAGPLHTPADLVKMFAEMGIRLKSEPTSMSGVRVYTANNNLELALFSDHDFCQKIMAIMPQ